MIEGYGTPSRWPAWHRREQSGSWAAWKADALWLTPYFILGVWVSAAMVCVPRASAPESGSL